MIAMVGIGNGAKDKVTGLLAGIDTNIIYLYAQMPVTDWRTGEQQAMRRGDGITLEDFAAIHQKIQGVSAMSLEVWPNLGKVSANGRTSSRRSAG